MGWYDRSRDISALNGKKLVSVTGADVGSQLVVFECEDGTKYEMYHDQDCCEYVSLEDVSGWNKDLQDATVLWARESGNTGDCSDGACEWTFYNIQTDKGHVQLRWYGESNGYYGTGVSFYEVTKDA